MMRRNRFLGVLLMGVILIAPMQPVWGTPGEDGSKPRQPISDIQRIYGSKDFNEAPFFISGTVAFETGDNRNDSLIFIPFQGYDAEPIRFEDPALVHEMENPRPDVPDGKSLVFSAIGKSGQKGIYTVDPLDCYALNKAKVTPLLTDGHNNWHPSLNKKQGILAYISDAEGAPQVFVMSLKTRRIRQLTFLSKAASPFIDAAGEWIYFAGTDANNNEDIYRIRPDGAELTRLTFSPEIEKYPTLTKYGKWIVYERGTQNTRSIWIMSLDGKVQKQLSDGAFWASAPCMNYTGTKVVFEGVINNRRGIYLGEVSDDVFMGATAKDFTPGLDVSREVVNISQFGSFTPEQLRKLSEYGFFAVPTDKKQLFYAYEENEYKNIPSFVTADNLLQLLHIVFDTSLRKTEERTLSAKLSQFTQTVLAELEKRKNLGNDASFITLRRYFSILYQLIAGKPYPKTALTDQTVVAAEMARIQAEQMAESALFPGRKFDYSLFKVRGHYDNSPALRRYFKAMSWIGSVSFATETPGDRRLVCLAAELLNANPRIVGTYQDINKITAFYVGASDDPNLIDLAAFWRKETGKGLSLAEYDDKIMKVVLNRLFEQAGAKIATHYRDPQKNQTRVLTLMGQRYVADSHLFSLFFAKLGEKYQPGGLDLFAALGNDTAYRLRKEDAALQNQFPGFDNALRDGKPIFNGIGEAKDAPLFAQWMKLLKTYANTEENGAPWVLKSPHWKKKKLNTGLASWAELKHDTVLYGKQTGAECGGGDEPPKVYGYIEPEVTFYKSLRAMLTSMDRDLKSLGTDGIHGLDRFLELTDFFILVSEKELKQIPLSTQENEQIRIIGGLLEGNTITALDANMRWFEITSESAKNMAVVADIYRYWGSFATVGVGYSDDLYIIIPVNGQLVMMRGSIFSYYEFLKDRRLNDAEWYEMLKTWKSGRRAAWWQPYLDAKKEEIPVPADPYDSGC